MRNAIALFAFLFIVGTAVAQNQNPPANQGPGNNAINTNSTNNPGAPVAGANSFTEGQAKSRSSPTAFPTSASLRRTTMVFGAARP